MTARDDLARVLAEHEDPTGWTFGDGDDLSLVYECACGDRSPALANETIHTEEAEVAAQWHREHQADAVIREWLPTVLDARIETLLDPDEGMATLAFGAGGGRWFAESDIRAALRGDA